MRGHRSNCAAYHERAKAVREALEQCGLGHWPIPPAHTDAALYEAMRLIRETVTMRTGAVWYGVLLEYQSNPDGDQFAELCDCGVRP